jgi:hypothetical protein
MTLSKIIYLQNKQLDLNKDSFKLTWQRLTRQQQRTARLLALLLASTTFMLSRKIPPSIFTGVINSFFSISLIATRKDLLHSLQPSLDSHSRQEPFGT